MNRRTFIQQLGWATALTGAHALPLQAFANDYDLVPLTILHTNDVHSRIEPFPMDGGPFQGKGGAARRAELIAAIRREAKNVLLLDAGDIFQGTPYFNFFGGELEMKLMSAMGYDAATMGNHDFDNGIDGFVKQLPHANFPILNCNYIVKDSALHTHIQPHIVIKKQGVKIGVIGVGIDLNGLVPTANWKGVEYTDPVAAANKTAAMLRHDKKCDYVICLSHLGYKYDNAKVSDVTLAQQSENIDLILGGHTHTFMPQPDIVMNQQRQPVIIHQVGWAGLALGRIDVVFERSKNKHCATCNAIMVQ